MLKENQTARENQRKYQRYMNTLKSNVFGDG